MEGRSGMGMSGGGGGESLQPGHRMWPCPSKKQPTFRHTGVQEPVGGTKLKSDLSPRGTNFPVG
eukprot:2202099-Rhodomonas_salina.1